MPEVQKLAERFGEQLDLSEWQQRYLERTGHCPFCDCDMLDLDGPRLDPYEDRYYAKVTCTNQDCGRVWDEVLTVTGAQECEE